MSNLLYDKLFACHEGNNETFLVQADGSKISYGSFLNLVGCFAKIIVSIGLSPGERLALQVEKSVEALAVYAACIRTGVIFLPLNTAYKPVEIEYFVRDSGARVLIASDIESFGSIDFGHDVILHSMNSNGKGSFYNLAASVNEIFDVVPRTSNDLAALLYTSGTTGRSKGAMLTHGNLLSNAETLLKEWRFTKKDILLHALPIFHTHGLFVATNIILLAQASMIFLPKFEVESVFAALPKCTSMMGVPTFYTRLLDDDRLSRESTQHMRLFVSGSAPLLAETHVQFSKQTGHDILERYGMTETNMNTSNPYEGLRRPGTVGKPLEKVELKITDMKSGAEVPNGKVGQIEVRGPNVFVGYWRMPEKTREELRDNGFFITGDMGFIDNQGYLQIVGRNKDVIISGGYNIYPKEVEMILNEQPGVLESAVIGVPNSDFGESVVGILVPDSNGILSLEKISSSISNLIAKFKLPRKLIVIDELPRNAMGKVQKNVLRDQYQSVLDD